MHELGLEMVSRGLFRTELAEDAAVRVKRVFPSVLQGVMWRTLHPADWMARVPIPVNRRFQHAVVELRRVVAEIIDGYRAAGIEDGDVLGLLLDARDDETGRPMTDEQLRDEVITLLVTGTETSSTTLSWMFHELGRHPRVAERLVGELDEVLGESQVSYDHLQRLHYTRNVITETLRLHTPSAAL